MKKIFFPIPICMAALMLLGCRTNPTASAPVSEPLISTETSKPKDNIVGELVIGSLPSGLTLETLPAKFVTITENVVIEPEWVEYVNIPEEFEWVEGDIKGFTHEFSDNTSSETRTEKYLAQEASTELVVVPPLYAEDGNLVKPLTVIERVLPAIYKSIDLTRIKSTAGPVVTTIIPYEYKDGKTRVPTSKPQTIEKVHPAVIKQIESRRVAQLPTVIIRDEMGQIVHKFDKYKDLVAFVQSGKTP